MNYYIDEDQLEIVEKTLYTAIEIVTLIPLQGDTVIEQFYAANTWTRNYLPNKIMRLSSAKPIRSLEVTDMREANHQPALEALASDVMATWCHHSSISTLGLTFAMKSAVFFLAVSGSRSIARWL